MTHKSLSEVLSFVLHLGTESCASQESTVKGLNVSETGNIQHIKVCFRCSNCITLYRY